MAGTRWFTSALMMCVVLSSCMADRPVAAPIRLHDTTHERNVRIAAQTKLLSTVTSSREHRSPEERKVRDVWWELAQCENDRSDDSAPYNARGDRYHGWFQFTLATWRSIGGTGDPHTYSYAYQRSMAIKLWKRVGRTWRTQWPGCARKLKLN